MSCHSICRYMATSHRIRKRSSSFSSEHTTQNVNMCFANNGQNTQHFQMNTLYVRAKFTIMSTYANDFGKDDGDGGLDAAVDDGTEAAERHEEPLGRVDGEHAPHRYRWNVRVLQQHSNRSAGFTTAKPTTRSLFQTHRMLHVHRMSPPPTRCPSS